MSPILWLLSAVIVVAAFALGASTANRWRNRRQRVQAVLAVAFFIAGVTAVMDVAHLQTRFAEQVNCNTTLLHVLQDRSDARSRVDASTHLAQLSLPPVLDDLRDGHLDDIWRVTAARDAFLTAATDRDQLDAVLNEPYPDCH